ncbi:MAG TPA: phosphate signaling complex protein PhoU [Verrucomicrobiae bacterium]|jgi:phosphate transport system protein
MPDLDRELAGVKKMLVTMGGLADDAVRRAISAMVNRDAGMASTGKETDKEIDELQLEIDEKAIELLPLARSSEELRFITVAMKIARDLERVGDEATTISRRAFDLSQDTHALPTVDVPRRAKMALSMLEDALKAFITGDSARAREVIPRDKEVDELNKQLNRELTQEIMANPEATPRCLNFMVISKSLERIGDHAKNIAEDVVYLYEGRDIRFTGRGKLRRAEPPRPD